MYHVNRIPVLPLLLTALLLTFGCSKDSNNPVTPPDNTGDTQAPTVSIVSPTANESVGRMAPRKDASPVSSAIGWVQRFSTLINSLSLLRWRQ